MLKPVPWLPSGLVTVTLQGPVLDWLLIVILTVIEVEFTKFVELTVILGLEKVTAAPLTKFVPETVMEVVLLCLTDDGLDEVTVGAALTVKTFVPVTVVPSPLVTVTLPAPVEADPEMVMVAVIEVELTKVVELTVIPVSEKVAASDAPLTKFGAVDSDGLAGGSLTA